jgi:hypothetical protein
VPKVPKVKKMKGKGQKKVPEVMDFLRRMQRIILSALLTSIAKGSKL